MATSHSHQEMPGTGSQNTTNGTMNHSHDEMPSTMHTNSSSDGHQMPKKPGGGATHHMLAPDDPDNPMAWPLWRKLYVSIAAFWFAFTVAYGATTFTSGVTGIVQDFSVTIVEAVLSYSIFFIGVATAPIHTPHLSERFGRKPIYLVSLFLFAICVLGVGFQKTFSGVLGLRFLAGMFGGPCLVLIEGTFADVWSARTTVTYYSFLTLGSYIGAAFGPIIGGFVFADKGWQWLNWVTLFFAAATWLFGFGMPETYSREILRKRARRQSRPHNLPAALSGVTLAEMAKHTVINPLRMLTYEPIVIGSSLYLGLNFAIVFQWFITVPVALNMAYDFAVQRAGLAFFAAVGGAILGAFTSTILEQAMGVRMLPKMGHNDVAPIERRLLTAMVGSFGVFASLFWIGFTAKPTVSFYSPIFGTALYVWGNFSVIVGFISWLFDAYPAQGTLSALTSAAVFRLICAGTVPVGILPMFMNLTPPWALATLGFLSLAMIPIPFLFYIFGARLRQRSSFGNGMSTVEMEMQMRHETGNGSA